MSKALSDPYVRGHVLSAFLIGVLLVELVPVWLPLAHLYLGAGALVSVLVCWFWPGTHASAIKLWAVGVMANPLALIALVSAAWTADCHQSHGCMIAVLSVMLILVCTVPPLIGLAARWVSRRSSEAAPQTEKT
jgi:hypothetical protein